MVRHILECMDLLKQKTEILCISFFFFHFAVLKDRAYSAFYIFAEKVLH